MFRKLEAYEYDIRKCNISVLRTLNIIDDDTYKRLYDAPRMERQVFVGKMMRDRQGLSQEYRDFVKRCVLRFKSINNLQDKDIIEVVHDALWVSLELLNTKLSKYIEFVCKRKSTCTWNIGKIVFYYDSLTGDFFQRGLGDTDSIWFEVIKKAMRLAEFSQQKEVYKYLHSIKKDYILKNLDDRYYVKLISNKDNMEVIDTMIKDIIK